MATPRLPQDRAVLQAKFRNVERLLRVYRDGAATVEASLHTLLITQPEADAARVVQTVLEALVPVSNRGVDISLIEADLRDIQASGGEEFESLLADCWGFLQDAQRRVLRMSDAAGQPAEYRDATFDFVFATILFLKLVTRPAGELQDRLARLLDRHPREKLETVGQSDRAARDRWILAMADFRNTSSPAIILGVGENDPTIGALKARGVRFSVDVIRGVLQRRKAKTHLRAKKTGQGKS